jgi:DNA polymerase elongation subunit (family B)
MSYIITDIATAPLDGCEAWLDEPVPPSNYTKPESIEKFKTEKRADQIERAGLDPDLARITGIAAWKTDFERPGIWLCRDEADEREALGRLVALGNYIPLIGYNALKFDWPFLMRRARYLGLTLDINTDRYRSHNVDLFDVLTHRGLLSGKSLGFYVKRLGWTDLVKPLSGAEEARVPVTGEWDKLADSLRHDVTATYRLACWLGVIQPQPKLSAAAVEAGF